MSNVEIQLKGSEILTAIEHYNRCIANQIDYISNPIWKEFTNLIIGAKHDKEIFLMCIERLKERFEKNQSKIRL